MAGNDYEFPYELNAEQDAASSFSVISVEQLQRLVQALVISDVSELELQRESDGVYLALRKVKASEMSIPVEGAMLIAAANDPAMPVVANTPAPEAKEKHHEIVAPLGV